mgnify:CR=1 FL=1
MVTRFELDDGRVLRMTLKNQIVLDSVERVLRGEISIGQAAVLIGKSYRQTKRIVSRVKREGMLGVLHKNKGRHPINRTAPAIKSEVMNLFRRDYWDFNLAHFRDCLETKHGITIKRETLRKWAKAEYLVKRAHKIRKRPKAHKRRARMPRSGMMVQFDGSRHLWIGKSGEECTLLGGIDDATSTCLHAEFCDSENTLSILTAIRKIVESCGVPDILYVDQAAHFGKHHNDFRIDWSGHMTHLERAMAELGSRVLFATSAQAKGRIERMWGTFQDRLVPELRQKGVRTKVEANRYLQEHFIADHNRRFAVPALDPTNGFRQLTDDERTQLDWIFCRREYRKITNGETLSFNSQIYLLDHAFPASLKGSIIEIRTSVGGEQAAYFAGRPVTLKPLGPRCIANKRAA